MLISTIGISDPFDIIDVVVGFASAAEGCDGSVKVPPVYDIAMARLCDSAKALHADAVIGVGFQNRVALGAGCNQGKKVFEVVAWGTAVKIRRAR